MASAATASSVTATRPTSPALNFTEVVDTYSNYRKVDISPTMATKLYNASMRACMEYEYTNNYVQEVGKHLATNGRDENQLRVVKQELLKKIVADLAALSKSLRQGFVLEESKVLDVNKTWNSLKQREGETTCPPAIKTRSLSVSSAASSQATCSGTRTMKTRSMSVSSASSQTATCPGTRTMKTRSMSVSSANSKGNEK